MDQKDNDRRTWLKEETLKALLCMYVLSAQWPSEHVGQYIEALAEHQVFQG